MALPTLSRLDTRGWSSPSPTAPVDVTNPLPLELDTLIFGKIDAEPVVFVGISDEDPALVQVVLAGSATNADAVDLAAYLAEHLEITLPRRAAAEEPSGRWEQPVLTLGGRSYVLKETMEDYAGALPVRRALWHADIPRHVREDGWQPIAAPALVWEWLGAAQRPMLLLQNIIKWRNPPWPRDHSDPRAAALKAWTLDTRQQRLDAVIGAVHAWVRNVYAPREGRAVAVLQGLKKRDTPLGGLVYYSVDLVPTVTPFDRRSRAALAPARD